MNLQLIQGDLLDQDVDVIVSAWNRNIIPWWLLLPQSVVGSEVMPGGVPIYNRDTLIVTGKDDIEGLKGMLALAKDALEKPRPISGVALRLDGDDWVSWLPEVSHALHDEFRILQVQSVGQDYEEQKDLLDRLHQKTGENIIVASFSARRNQETGIITTYCVWAKDVLSLLPDTDRIAFVSEGLEPVMVAWNMAVEVVGHLMEPQGMYPERYRVAGFPTDEQLAAMRNLLA